MFRDAILIATLALSLALGCGGGMSGDDPAATAEDTQEGGEAPAAEDTQEGGEAPPVEPSAEGSGGVDVNGGDVGGGSPSDD